MASATGTKKKKKKAKKSKAKAEPMRNHPKLALSDKQRIRIKKRITQLREAAGMSKGELAAAIGCGYTYLYQMENTKQPGIFSVPALFAIAKVLGTNVSAILKGIK